jgi:hypothetical protein
MHGKIIRTGAGDRKKGSQKLKRLGNFVDDKL